MLLDAGSGCSAHPADEASGLVCVAEVSTAGAGSATEAPPSARGRDKKATISVPVGTIATTVQPSPECESSRGVSVDAWYDETLIDVYSSMREPYRRRQTGVMAGSQIALDGYAITDAMETFTATLAIIVGVAALVVLALWASGRRELLARVTRYRSAVTLVLAGGAMAGSLYFSEVANYIPCRLCWFQRIAMYPLAVIGFIGFIRRDPGARWYALPIAGVGACVSAWHYLIEWRPGLDGGSCAASGPACSDIWFRSYGFVTLAFMALMAFVGVIVINLVPAEDA